MTPSTEMAIVANTKYKWRRRLVLSLRGWELAMIWSLGGAAFAALAVVVSTAAVVVLQREENEQTKAEFERYKLDATRDIEGAQERAKVAEQKAAEANLALAKFKAPRVLSSEQQRHIAGKLKQFAGTEFDAGVGPKGDPEPIYLARTIGSALGAAGWKFIAWTGGTETYSEPPMPPIGLTSVTNVIIDVHPDRWEKYGAAATSLASALNDEGIEAIASSNQTSVNTDAIHIRIGRKL
jgi:hypothetical protein